MRSMCRRCEAPASAVGSDGNMGFSGCVLDMCSRSGNSGFMQDTPATYSDMESFIGTASAKGWIGATSGKAISSTLRRLRSTLEEHEAQDVHEIDAADVLRRFQNKNRDVSGGSLNAYQSRLSSAIKMYLEWRENRAGWRPRSSGGRPPKSATKSNPKPSRKGQAAEDTPPDPGTHSIDRPDDSKLSYPFPLREGVVVRLNGLPPDLTGAEVERIARFLRVLCVD